MRLECWLEGSFSYSQYADVSALFPVHLTHICMSTCRFLLLNTSDEIIFADVVIDVAEMYINGFKLVTAD